IIEYYCDQNELINAKKYVGILENLDFDVSGNPVAELNYLSGKAKYLQTTGDLEKALALTQRKLNIAKKLKIEDEIMQTYSLLS
ncbi:hypothetical protein O4H25_14800, partial [Staphylococcus equorum]